MKQEIEYKIHGDDVQFVQIILDPGETMMAEVGTLFFKDSDIQMQTNMEGGFFKGLGRMVTGESFFITSFYNNHSSKKKQVCFAAPYIGKVIPIDMDEIGGEFLCQKDSFLCAVKGVEIEVAFTKKMGAGLFGGEGFILQRLKGEGLGFIHAGGSIVKLNLKPGQVIEVDTGCIVGFSKTVDYDIKFVGGFKNALFGGEGLFLARIEGPGIVYLQSLPFSKMADRVISAAGFVGRKGDTGIGGIGDLASLAGIAGKIIK